MQSITNYNALLVFCALYVILRNASPIENSVNEPRSLILHLKCLNGEISPKLHKVATMQQI